MVRDGIRAILGIPGATLTVTDGVINGEVSIGVRMEAVQDQGATGQDQGATGRIVTVTAITDG